MWVFVLRRLLALPPLLLVISALTYGLLQLAPGDFFKKLEENPTVEQDYVMGLRRSAGKAIEIEAEERAGQLGTFRVGETEFSFDTAGQLLLAGEPTDPRLHQTEIKKFTWPEGEEGETWTVTEQGRVVPLGRRLARVLRVARERAAGGSRRELPVQDLGRHGHR